MNAHHLIAEHARAEAELAAAVRMLAAAAHRAGTLRHRLGDTDPYLIHMRADQARLKRIVDRLEAVALPLRADTARRAAEKDARRYERLAERAADAAAAADEATRVCDGCGLPGPGTAGLCDACDDLAREYRQG